MTQCHKDVWNWGCIISSLSPRRIINIDVEFDFEAKVFIAHSPDLPGLVVEAKTLDLLQIEVQYCIEELINLELNPSL